MVQRTVGTVEADLTFAARRSAPLPLPRTILPYACPQLIHLPRQCSNIYCPLRTLLSDQVI